eukprot:INCI705.2.p2 GENE.INCI705.2~~INCI705.2.p2  ORF type:complete len:741 (-),score=155.57 INCI705.2:2970-5192(-)
MLSRLLSSQARATWRRNGRFASALPVWRGLGASADYTTTADGLKQFEKVLIANRGEISCRVIKSCKKLGIKTVAIYSEADADAKHVRMADEAYCVGPAPSNQSYLNIDKVIDIVKRSGAEAVHPGYGFLSENRNFAKALQSIGVEFVGPSPEAIWSMGDKIMSMRLAQEAGVSCAPRYDGEVRDVGHALELARDIGYPVIMKASAGGGGKGMRVAWSEGELADGFRLAREEAKSSFGDDRMLLQHFVCPTDGRHIEIQVIADKFGNVACFPERECSIQRRKQKVIEESPSVLLSEETRLKMQQQAADLCQKVGYHTAGTVEFLADNDQNFYFLEMNTRLQVEHPVSEEVTGEDLVELMLRVAAGNKLPDHLRHAEGSQEFQDKKCWSVPFKGWSFESRVYAEDPLRGFLPSIGNLQRYLEPTSALVPEGVTAEEQRVRCDSGVFEGSEISMHYDPMISKLITFANSGPGKERESRQKAIDLMCHSLDHYVIRGLNDNICFLRALYEHPDFVAGRLTTDFLDNEYKNGFHGIELTELRQRELAGVAATMVLSKTRGDVSAIDPQVLYCGVTDDTMQKVHVAPNGSNGVLLTFSDESTMELNDVAFQAHNSLFEAIASNDKGAVGPLVSQFLDMLDNGVKLKFLGNTYNLSVRTEKQQQYSKFMIPKVPVDTSKFCMTPMPGTLISLSVNVGDTVESGQEIAVVEAMKMQNILRAEKKGTVKAILADAGAVLSLDEVIVEFD